MTVRMCLQDRRLEERRHVPVKRIAWMRADPSKAFTGWVSDTATSSLAFVTPTRDQPSAGEEIELTIGVGGVRLGQPFLILLQF